MPSQRARKEEAFQEGRKGLGGLGGVGRPSWKAGMGREAFPDGGSGWDALPEDQEVRDARKGGQEG